MINTTLNPSFFGPPDFPCGRNNENSTISRAMSEEMNFEDASYLRCEINGTQFLVKTVPEISEISDGQDEKEASDYQDSSQFDNEDDSIPLVYLDRQIYTLQDGELREFDISKFVNQSDPEARETSNESEDSPITEYLNEDDILVEQVDDGQDSYDVVVNDNKLIIGEDVSVNANDFMEVVTALKCKICSYTTQDRVQLLEHFENVHINPVLQVKKKKNRF